MNEYICRYWVEADWDDWNDKFIPAGFREVVSITAATRGKAKSQFVQYLRSEGYDVAWIDRFSIRKVRA
jgi:hypothetical protein